MVVVCGHCLVTLSLTVNETLKWLSSLPILMQESFWWWQCSDRYTISLSPTSILPPSPPPPTFSPSQISLMVSVDVKHHVYLLTNEAYRWIYLHFYYYYFFIAFWAKLVSFFQFHFIIVIDQLIRQSIIIGVCCFSNWKLVFALHAGCDWRSRCRLLCQGQRGKHQGHLSIMRTFWWMFTSTV